ncbi:hypothetical protein GMORB2_5984, partial [Geosmithia morbida]
KVFEDKSSIMDHILTYLDNEPPIKRLAIGTSTQVPPTTQTFTENPDFVRILNQVVEDHGHEDEDVTNQARALAGMGSHNLGSGAGFLSGGQSQRKRRGSSARQGGAGGAGGQGGAGGGGIGGWVHLSDRRNPPDFGRIAFPEDILASVQVDGSGRVVGKAQPSGTYRILTNQGILGLSPFLRKKLVERLQQEAAKE